MYSVKSVSSLHSGQPSIQCIDTTHNINQKSCYCKVKHATSPPSRQVKRAQQPNQYYPNQSGASQNLHTSSHHVHSPQHYVHSHDIGKLNKKIRTIKTALKIAQQHNEQLHSKIGQYNQLLDNQKTKYQAQIQKYKSLYEILVQKYEEKNKQAKKYKKLLKNVHQQGPVNDNKISQQRIQELEEAKNQLRQLLTAQQVKLQHFQRQNNLLRQEIVSKNRKVNQLEQKFIQSSRVDNKQKSQMKTLADSQINKIQQLQYNLKLSTNEKQNILRNCQQMKIQIQQLLGQLQRQKQLKEKAQKQNEQSTKEIHYLKAQIQHYERQNRQMKKLLQTQTAQLKEDCQIVTEKYNQLLTVYIFLLTLYRLLTKDRKISKGNYIQLRSSQQEGKQLVATYLSNESTIFSYFLLQATSQFNCCFLIPLCHSAENAKHTHQIFIKIFPVVQQITKQNKFKHYHFLLFICPIW